jgi:hypothetical protein
MLELLVALAILMVAFSIVWTTFSVTVTAWNRGDKLIEELHHGDFVMEQLISALRSAAFFKNKPDKYGFWLEDRGGGQYPRDEISWVTSGSAFMLPDSPLINGLHRIMISIEDNDEGDPSVAIRAFPHLAEEIEKGEADPWFVSTRVKGIDCRVYDFESEDWSDDWEDTNSIPSVVEVTLFMEPLERYGEPVKMTRVMQIPISVAVTGAVQALPRGGAQPGQAQPQQQPAGAQPGGVQPGGIQPGRGIPQQPGGVGSPLQQPRQGGLGAPGQPSQLGPGSRSPFQRPQQPGSQPPTGPGSGRRSTLGSPGR